MKTFVLTVSRVFPGTHKRKGELTHFIDKIYFGEKIHTIRANYELWEKRIKEVQDGKAILSIRYWSGKPYNSKQVEVCQLDKDSGIGVQKLMFNLSDIKFPQVDDGLRCFWVNLETLGKNDRLSIEDFKEWFKGYDLSKPMAIIHFTKLRY